MGQPTLVRPEADPVVVATLREAAAAVARGHNDPPAAVRLLARALDEPPRPADRAGVLAELARAEAAIVDATAVGHLEQALEPLEDPGEQADTIAALARLLHWGGDFAGAAALALRGEAELATSLAHAAFAEHPLVDHTSEGMSLAFAGIALVDLDAPAIAGPLIGGAVAAARRRGAVLTGSVADHLQALLDLRHGELGAALAHAQRSLTAYHNGWVDTPWAAPALVSIHVERGDLGRGRRGRRAGRGAGGRRHRLRATARGPRPAGDRARGARGGAGRCHRVDLAHPRRQRGHPRAGPGLRRPPARGPCRAPAR